MSGKGETKLIYPGLANFYASVGPIAYALVRVVVGIMFLMHVSGKFKVGAAAVAANVMAKNGLEPSLVFAYAAIVLETVGGACLVIGLFTRPVAAALAIEMAIALLFVHLSKGYAAGGGGYEYVLLIGMALFAIAMYGGGRYSADRMIGKEV
jgi:putative oxidoreductase